MEELHIPEEDGAFIERVLKIDAAERPTADTLLQNSTCSLYSLDREGSGVGHTCPSPSCRLPVCLVGMRKIKLACFAIPARDHIPAAFRPEI